MIQSSASPFCVVNCSSAVIWFVVVCGEFVAHGIFRVCRITSFSYTLMTFPWSNHSPLRFVFWNVSFCFASKCIPFASVMRVFSCILVHVIYHICRKTLFFYAYGKLSWTGYFDFRVLSKFLSLYRQVNSIDDATNITCLSFFPFVLNFMSRPR